MIWCGVRIGLLGSRLSLYRSLHTLNARQTKLFVSKLEFVKSRSSLRCINTTDKNKDHQHIDIYDPDYVNAKKPTGPQTAKDFADVSSQKSWISYGFDYVDPKNDSFLFHGFFFSMVTLSFITFMYAVYYYPDVNLKDWALREAYMELDRREKLGLPLIDPNLVDPEKINLHSDEELGDYEIYT